MALVYIFATTKEKSPSFDHNIFTSIGSASDVIPEIDLTSAQP